MLIAQTAITAIMEIAKELQFVQTLLLLVAMSIQDLAALVVVAIILMIIIAIADALLMSIIITATIALILRHHEYITKALRHLQCEYLHHTIPVVVLLHSIIHRVEAEASARAAVVAVEVSAVVAAAVAVEVVAVHSAAEAAVAIAAGDKRNNCF